MRPVRYTEKWYDENLSESGERRCRKCGKYGDVATAFYPNHRNKNVCRYCWSQQSRKRRLEDPEGERQRVKDWRAKRGGP